MVTTASPAAPPRQPSKGWVPQQHGAWAMMIVPFVLGAIWAAKAGAFGWGHVTLFAFWMLGYFTFNSASGWLKAAARQKPRYVRPLVVYGASAAVFGALTLLLVGLRPLPWVLVFLPLMLPAIWLAGQRKERATVGGFLTIAAASVILPVARYLYPSGAGDWPFVAATAGMVFGYFSSTVLFVKTNIRERGSRAYLIASIVYHALVVVAAVVLTALGLVHWWWIPFAVVVLAKAIVVPPMRLRPLPLGIMEIILSVAIIVLFTVFAV